MGIYRRDDTWCIDYYFDGNTKSGKNREIPMSDIVYNTIDTMPSCSIYAFTNDDGKSIHYFRTVFMNLDRLIGHLVTNWLQAKKSILRKIYKFMREWRNW